MILMIDLRSDYVDNTRYFKPPYGIYSITNATRGHHEVYKLEKKVT